MKIAFFGTPRFAQIVLEKLINTPYKPDIVITSPDTPAGRGRQLQPSPVKLTASKNNIEILEPKGLTLPARQSFSDGGDIGYLKFDIGILVAYGHILPEQILKIPKHGILNLHPSLLPKYRGPSPIQTAILNGDTKTGVSIIRLDEEVDHGPILAQQEIGIDPNDNNQTLHEKLGEEGAKLLLLALPDYISGKAKPAAQDHTKVTFTKHITKEDGQIDLTHPPTHEQFDHMVRAYSPWPGAWTETKLKMENGKWKVIKLKFLPDNKIQPEGKKPMTIPEFRNGYPHIYKELSILF